MKLSAAEERAADLYGRWIACRDRLDAATSTYESQKILISQHQEKRNPAVTGNARVPSSKALFDAVNAQLQPEKAAAKAMYEEGWKVIEEVREEPPEVRQAFWSVMTVRGLRTVARITNDASIVFFVQSAHTAHGTSMFEREALPIDPIDRGSTDDLYCWNLKNGDLDCLTAKILPQKWGFGGWNISSAGDCVTLVVAGPPSNDMPSPNIMLMPTTGGQPTMLLGDGPLVFENLPLLKIEKGDRYIGTPLISGDGNRVVFICGTYINRDREEGYVIESYVLACWDLTTGKVTALTTCPVGTLLWPALSQDGSTVMVLTVQKAFEPMPARLPEYGDRPRPDEAAPYLIKVDGSAPARRIDLPAGITWPGQWERRNPPLSLARDGSKAAIEYKIDGNSNIYFFNGETGALTTVSAAADGRPASGRSTEPVISADGRWIVFLSDSRDICAPGNGCEMVYLYDTQTGNLSLMSRDESGKPPACHSRSASISADGRAVAFISHTEVVPGTVSSAMLERVKVYRCDRLVVIDPQTGVATGLSGRFPAIADH